MSTLPIPNTPMRATAAASLPACAGVVLPCPCPETKIPSPGRPGDRIFLSARPEPVEGRLQHLHPGDLLALRVHGVDRAGEAGVERVDRPQRLERELRIGDRVADERLLVGAEVPCRVARAGVPGRGDDRLVVLELAVLD